VKCPPPITERFTNHNELYLAEAFVKIGTQMSSSNGGRVAANVVLPIDLPPRIKNSAGRRLFQQSDELLERLCRHKVPKVPTCHPSPKKGRRLFMGHL
jgi:hypothetical protein